MDQPISADEVQSARALGRLEGRLSSLEERMDRAEAGLNSRLSGIEQKLDALGANVAQATGGVRLGMWLGDWARILLGSSGGAGLMYWWLHLGFH